MNSAVPKPPSANPAFIALVAKTRHDLNNSFGQVLGFAELLLDEVQEPAHKKLRSELELIFQTARQLVALNNEVLNARRADIPHHTLGEFDRTVRDRSNQVATAADSVARKSRELKDDIFRSDLAPRRRAQSDENHAGSARNSLL